ncbi:hypothetical protein F5Y18DRAFT_382765 [Xylariaceae sp. FL1019]|nr:hypothetical protein F5Y18DRAFT_382765 [Xylariaceae sp. FL1019]
MKRTMRRFLGLLGLKNDSSDQAKNSDVEPQRAGQQHGAPSPATAPRITNGIGNASKKVNENQETEQPRASGQRLAGHVPPRKSVSNEPKVAAPRVPEPRVPEPRVAEPRVPEPRVAEPRIGDNERRDSQANYSKKLPDNSKGSKGVKRTMDDLDLTNTTDTTVETSQATTVTHETVRPHVHEIIQEQVTRDIHTYDVYHRIQPIYDVEVLPARHFVQGPDGRIEEVAAAELPTDCTGPNARWRAGLMSSAAESESQARADKSLPPTPRVLTPEEPGMSKDGTHSAGIGRESAKEYYPDYDTVAASKVEKLVLPIHPTGLRPVYSPAASYS